MGQEYTMNGYERALATLQRRPTDCTATWGGWVVSDAFFSMVTGKEFWDDPLTVACEAYRKLNVDIILQTFFLPESREEYRAYTHHTATAQEAMKNPEAVVAYIEQLPEPEALEKDFNWEKQIAWHRRDYEDFQQKLGEQIFLMPKCKCTRFIWYIDFGYENYLEALALYPEHMHKLFRTSAAEMRLLNQVRADLVQQGVMPPYFFCGHDICGNNGPIISPRMLRDLYFPYLKQAFEPLVEIDAEIVWHCDGYIMPILADLAQAGVSGFQGFQEETGFSVADVAKQHVRDSKTPLLWAGLSVTSTLPFGTVEDVRRDVERIIDTVGSQGGLALGTANTAGPDCPPENIAMLYTHPHRYVCMKPS